MESALERLLPEERTGSEYQIRTDIRNLRVALLLKTQIEENFTCAFLKESALERLLQGRRSEYQMMTYCRADAPPPLLHFVPSAFSRWNSF